MTTHLSIAPRLTVLPKGDASHLDLLVRLRADEAPLAATRPTLNLCLAIDKSGSMAGDPLEQAKQAAIHLIQRLQKGDQVSVVAYGQTIDVVVEPVDALEGRELLLRSIRSIQAGGGTPLREGWLTAAGTIAPFQSKFGISRVLLLSDGQATDFSTPDGLGAEAEELRASGITTSTYGLGFNFNETLMTQLGQRGGGLAFYAGSAEELIPYFESEFAMLAATVGRSVSVKLDARIQGTSVPLSIQRLDTEVGVTGQAVSLPALVSGAEAWVALRVALPATASKQSLVLSSEATWQSMDGAPQFQEAVLEIPVKAKAVTNPDQAVEERLKEVEAARLQREVLQQARQGNWEAAQGLLRGMTASAGNNVYIAGVAASLSGMAAAQDMNGLSKEVTYSSYAMTSRVADNNENAAQMSVDRFNLRKASQSRSSR